MAEFRTRLEVLHRHLAAAAATVLSSFDRADQDSHVKVRDQDREERHDRDDRDDRRDGVDQEDGDRVRAPRSDWEGDGEDEERNEDAEEADHAWDASDGSNGSEDDFTDADEQRSQSDDDGFNEEERSVGSFVDGGDAEDVAESDEDDDPAFAFEREALQEWSETRSRDRIRLAWPSNAHDDHDAPERESRDILATITSPTHSEASRGSEPGFVPGMRSPVRRPSTSLAPLASLPPSSSSSSSSLFSDARSGDSSFGSWSGLELPPSPDPENSSARTSHRRVDASHAEVPGSSSSSRKPDIGPNRRPVSTPWDVPSAKRQPIPSRAPAARILAQSGHARVPKTGTPDKTPETRRTPSPAFASTRGPLSVVNLRLPSPSDPRASAAVAATAFASSREDQRRRGGSMLTARSGPAASMRVPESTTPVRPSSDTPAAQTRLQARAGQSGPPPRRRAVPRVVGRVASVPVTDEFHDPPVSPGLLDVLRS